MRLHQGGLSLCVVQSASLTLQPALHLQCVTLGKPEGTWNSWDEVIVPEVRTSSHPIVLQAVLLRGNRMPELKGKKI